MKTAKLYTFTEIKPRYCENFKCIGGACPASCCCDWGYITWKDNEYDKLMKANLSDDLKARTTAAFYRDKDVITQEDYWNIKEIPMGDSDITGCPMITDEGLCLIQKELGASYLSRTCSVFPRAGYYSKQIYLYNCSGACPEVLNLLLANPEAMQLVRTDKAVRDWRQSTINAGYIDTKERLTEYPILNYRTEIFDFFYALLSDESCSLETEMVLGSIAAKRLNALQESRQFDKIPDELRALSENLVTPERIEQIDSIQPRYDIKLGTIARFFILFSSAKTNSNSIIRTIFNNLLVDGDNDSLNLGKYLRGKERFTELLDGREYFWRNAALNSFIEIFVEFFNKDFSIYDLWLSYCVFYSMLTFTVYSSAYAGNDMSGVLKELSVLLRITSHRHTYMSRLAEHLKSEGSADMGHIALMLK